MKLHVYTYYNKKASYYLPPFTSKNNVAEEIEELSHGIPYVKAEEAIQLIDCDVYCLGTFDTIDGTLEYSKEFVMPLGDEIKKVLEGAKDGTKDA